MAMEIGLKLWNFVTLLARGRVLVWQVIGVKRGQDPEAPWLTFATCLVTQVILLTVPQIIAQTLMACF